MKELPHQIRPLLHLVECPVYNREQWYAQGSRIRVPTLCRNRVWSKPKGEGFVVRECSNRTRENGFK